MLELSVPIKLILSFLIGAFIGLEREAQDYPKNKKVLESSHHWIGVRTFALITLLGTFAGILFNLYLIVSVIVTVSFMLLLITYYIFSSISSKDMGITTEIAVIFGYLIGMIIGLGALSLEIILAFSIVLVLILSRKEDIKKIILGIRREEFLAFTSYAILALVILPFLPNTDYSISDIPNVNQIVDRFNWNLGEIATTGLFNPFKLWSIVALITGIDMAGYILERTVGQKRGRIIASLVGGFISSTATTQALAVESKSTKNIYPLLAGALFANAVSFVPIVFIVGALNVELLLRILPILIILFVGCMGFGIYFLTRKSVKLKSKKQKEVPVHESQIFSLGPAIKFAGIYLVIRIASEIGLIMFGQAGFFVTSGIGALTGIDAVTINIANLAGNTIVFQTALIAFLIVNAVNLGAKSFYSFATGSREFAIKFSISVLLVTIASFVSLLFVL